MDQPVSLFTGKNSEYDQEIQTADNPVQDCNFLAMKLVI